MKKNKLKVLALIGARAGSKGVPDKNVKMLAGKPLMAWIIKAAKSSKLVDRVLVSTDAPRYAVIARRYGAEAPFLRPKKLAGGLSTDLEFIAHALTWLKEHEQYVPDIVVRLLTTVPLQSQKDIDGTIRALIEDPRADSAVAITSARQHPSKALKLVSDRKSGFYVVSYFSGKGKDATPLTRQSYEKAYVRGNIVASRLKTIQKGTLTGNRVRYHMVPAERAVDIDSLLDFFLAEKLLQKRTR